MVPHARSPFTDTHALPFIEAPLMFETIIADIMFRNDELDMVSERGERLLKFPKHGLTELDGLTD